MLSLRKNGHTHVIKFQVFINLEVHDKAGKQAGRFILQPGFTLGGGDQSSSKAPDAVHIGG